MSGCKCEEHRQSAYSPCTVNASEEIVYCLIDPDLIDKGTGELKKKAFSKSVLSKTDLSVVRADYSSEAEIWDCVVTPQLKTNPARIFCGVLVAQASDIRGIADCTIQDVCVADAGLKNFAAHAHLGFSSEVASSNKSVQVAVRANLIDVFNRRGGPITLTRAFS
ncbi:MULTISPECIES: hypothetical protein [unclassified Sulfitobacter]|uniref:hypothetical protein n=1 Tax=unclassified Sulfitobacter TaxID=196795 RepID=UPI0023E0D51A|nr:MULTISPECIES: hypothetical protein [unclassified Sulfitobacter]MDF3381956.1 hypothetical protein [Sulfitobacter sp. Ks11]MDF3385375.1 hypothetical protein [Sulfitobacter sp. M85]MDF3388794.1 hypothetical protein [Sulfitobacter sp. Ks16]MDF3399431.1 hypothetical protein [Sulfitobacter sp. KE39]MDF3402852.1 hypothetical protein [Sulfitobacter sp. Ks35]